MNKEIKSHSTKTPESRKSLQDVFSDNWYVEYLEENIFPEFDTKDITTKTIKDSDIRELFSEAMEVMAGKTRKALIKSAMPLIVDYLISNISYFYVIENGKIIASMFEKNTYELLFEEEINYFTHAAESDSDDSNEITSKQLIDILNNNRNLWKKR